MARYIDAELLKENFAKRLNNHFGITIKIDDVAVDLGLAIADTPTTDVVEVKHGEWENFEIPHMIRCSECGVSDLDIHRKKFDYCPYCGAKMDGGKAE